MSTKKTTKAAPRDILDEVLATGALEPETITLRGADIDIRRTWTGEQVSEYLRSVRTLKEAAADEATDEDTPTDEQIFHAFAAPRVAALSVSPAKDVAAFVDELEKLSVLEVTLIFQRMAVVAGLQDAEGKYLVGIDLGETQTPSAGA